MSRRKQAQERGQACVQDQQPRRGHLSKEETKSHPTTRQHSKPGSGGEPAVAPPVCPCIPHLALLLLQVCHALLPCLGSEVHQAQAEVCLHHAAVAATVLCLLQQVLHRVQQVVEGCHALRQRPDLPPVALCPGWELLVLLLLHCHLPLWPWGTVQRHNRALLVLLLLRHGDAGSLLGRALRSDGETTGRSVRCANPMQNPMFCPNHSPLGLPAGCETDCACVVDAGVSERGRDRPGRTLELGPAPSEPSAVWH